MKIKYHINFIFILLTTITYGQRAIPISFQATLDDKPLELGNKSNLGKSVDVLKFYISNLALKHQNIIVFKENQSYHLLDSEVIDGMKIEVTIPENLTYDEVSFDLGIDSTTNVSGALGGDLDPIKGMYWTWQSGYINFKLEGKHAACPARNNMYQNHIGGYKAPYYCFTNVKLNISSNASINIAFNLDKLFNQIDVTQNYKIMSPNQKAMEFSALLPSLFSVIR